MRSLVGPLGGAAFVMFASLAAAQGGTNEAAQNSVIEEVVVVESSRRGQMLEDMARSARVLTREDLEVLLQQTTSVQEILGKAVPGFAPPVTEGSAGSLTLRGRDPLFLIDGVPLASNTNFSRFLDKFDPLTIDRVEVVYGPTALYGSGATGGVIQFFTQNPSDEPMAFNVFAQTRAFAAEENAFDDDGLTYKLAGSVNGAVTDWLSIYGLLSYERTGGNYRAEGDLLTGRSSFVEDMTFFGKARAELGRGQSLTGTWSQTSLDFQDRSFELTEVDAGDGTVIAGEVDFPFVYADEPRNEFVYASLNYLNEALAGGALSLLGYYSESEFLNPGSDIRAALQTNGGPFPSTWPGLFQTGRNTEEFGFRAQYSRDWSDRLNVAVGADYNDAESDSLMPISSTEGFDETGFFDAAIEADQTPPFDLVSYGAFLEGSFDVTNRLTLSGGLRWDQFEYDVGEYDVVFTFAPGIRPGGSAEADGVSVNIGATYVLNDSITLFTNYSEGFATPSLGFVFNNVPPGTSVADSNLIEPVFTESIEVGFRGEIGTVSYAFGAYSSESEFSTTVSVDPATGLANRTRAPVEIIGFEASTLWRPTEAFSLEANLTYVDGEVDRTGDGDFVALSTQDNPPPKLSLVPTYTFNERQSVFGQVLYVGSRDDAFDVGIDANPVDAYTLVDAGFRQSIGSGLLSVQVTNLLNEDYVPAGEISFIPGRIRSGLGRTISLSYDYRF